jgi:hypothetical protein
MVPDSIGDPIVAVLVALLKMMAVLGAVDGA